MAKPRMPIPYSQELAACICERVADGENFRKICEDPAMPDRSTLRRWEGENQEFRALLDAARHHQADAHFDNILRIAMEIGEAPSDATGTEVSAYRAQLAVAAFQIDTLKWIASRLDPKRYSDRAPARQPEQELVDSAAQLVADIRAGNPDAIPELSSDLA